MSREDFETEPSFDSQQFKDVLEDALHGRKIETYVKALESAGFRYYPPERLPAWQDGRPRVEGEWRHVPMRLALTDNLICSWFETPRDFAFWFRKQVLRRRGRK